MRGSGDRVRSSQLSRLPQQLPSPTPVMLPGAAYRDWEAIYSDNVGRIYRLMFSKVGNRPDAEDLTSQVFLTAYSPLRTTAGIAQVRAYLTATARTVLAEHWRRTLGHQVTEIDPLTDLADYADASHSPADAHSLAEERAARILEALPQRQRQILTLRFLRGYSIRQAASELGVTIANAKVLQHRALRAAAGLDLEAHEQHAHGQGRGQGQELEQEQRIGRGLEIGQGLETGERQKQRLETGQGERQGSAHNLDNSQGLGNARRDDHSHRNSRGHESTGTHGYDHNHGHEQEDAS